MSDLALRAIELSDMVKALRRELALAQEARLAAELRAEGLRSALAKVESGCGPMNPGISAFCARALAAPPADIGLLRDLVSSLEAYPVGGEGSISRARDAALEAYPFLASGAEPAKEVPE